MSTISSGTTLTTALVQTGDTTGDLVIKTGSSNTTALTISGTDQSVTINGSLTANVNVTTLTGVVKVANGGTNASTASDARTNLGLVIGTDVLAPTGTGTGLTALNASNVTSGTLAVARGGTGTASPSLVGGTNITISGTWPNQTVTAAGGGVTSAVAGNGIAVSGATGAVTFSVACPSVDTVGSYAFAALLGGNGSNTPGSTRAGNLRFASVLQANCLTYVDYTSTTLSGTWRCMGYVNSQAGPSATVWCRIS